MGVNPFNDDGDFNEAETVIEDKPIHQVFIKKYRPKSLSGIYLPEPLHTKINSLKSIPNLLITGNPGTGKTCTIKQLAKKIYGSYYHDAVLELNASDNRGLEIINNSIIYFCRKKLNDAENKPLCKLVIMDEADNITKKAQNMISNFMEEYNNNTNFVFTCNDSSKLIEAIQSRCVIMYFPNVKQEMIETKLLSICEMEGISHNREAIEQIALNANGDMRSAILNLEMVYYGGNVCDVETVQLLSHQPPKGLIIEVIKTCAMRKLQEAIRLINSLKNRGYCSSDIILSILQVIQLVNIDEEVRMKYIQCISQSYINISDGIDTNLQLYGCLANLVLS